MARRCRRGTNSSASESGATIAVRPEGNRKINLPSEVMPTTRPRTDPARRDVEATDSFLLCELDWLAVAGCVASSDSEGDSGSPAAAEELPATAAGEAPPEATGTAACRLAVVGVGG